MDIEYQNFCNKFFTYLATGARKVIVVNGQGKEFGAEVIEVNISWQTIRVRFDSDNLTKPATRMVQRPFSMDQDDMMVEHYHEKVKEDSINYKYIKF
jgi:hypothetical protein